MECHTKIAILFCNSAVKCGHRGTNPSSRKVNNVGRVCEMQRLMKETWEVDTFIKKLILFVDTSEGKRETGNWRVPFG
jgi:hypothetical protein